MMPLVVFVYDFKVSHPEQKYNRVTTGGVEKGTELIEAKIILF